MWGCSPPTPATHNSPTPARCPNFQLNSDTIYHRQQIPQCRCSVLQDCSVIQMPITTHRYRLEVLMTPSLNFRCQLQVLVITCTSERLTINQRFPQPLPRVRVICQRGSGNQFTHQVTSLLRRIQKDTNQLEDEDTGTVLNRRTSILWEFGDGFRRQTPSFLGFYGRFITQASLINSLAIGDWFNLQPIFPPRKTGGGAESSNPLFWIGSPDNPIFRCFPKIVVLTYTQLWQQGA